MEHDPNSLTWLVLGIIFIIIEVFAIPGIGFLFAGLGAITLGALLTFDLMFASGWTEHIAYFFFFTTVWAVILWVPLKNTLKNKNGEGYSNIVGTSAEVTEDLISGKIGQVKWSGARMRARIIASSDEEKIPKGETVWVHENKGGILHVSTEELK